MSEFHPPSSVLPLLGASAPPTINDHTLRLVTYTHSDLVLRPEFTKPIIDLVNIAYAVHIHRFKGPRLKGHQQFCEELSEDGTIFFTLYLGPNPVATGGIKPAHSPQVCKLHIFATSPASFRTGYGSLMLTHAESVAFEKGYKKMTMQTVKENDDVLSFYLKRGHFVVLEVKLPDEMGSWRECESWAPKAPFTLCFLEKELGDG